VKGGGSINPLDLIQKAIEPQVLQPAGAASISNLRKLVERLPRLCRRSPVSG